MWHYRAKEADGETREGLLNFRGAEEVLRYLHNQGLTVISIEEERELKSFIQRFRALLKRLSQIGTVPLQELALFFRQLAALSEAGIVLGSALEVLERQCSCPPLVKIIGHLKRSVSEGSPLSEAMRQHSLFDKPLCALILAGEESGLLNRSLEQIALYLEQRESLRKKIFSAVTYPAVVMVFSLVVLWILVTRVIPQFQQVFERMDIPMPSLTEKVFAVSSWMIQNGLWMLLLFLAMVLVFLFMHRSAKARRFLDPLKLRCPICGPLLRLAVMTRGLQTLGALAASGVPILRALELSAQAADNYEISKGFRELCDAAVRGESLGLRADGLSVFPPMTVQMIKVGEESGRLDAMILKASEWYRQDLEERVKKLTAMIEPLLTVFVGAVVALVATAIFSPVISAVRTLSR